MRLANKTTRLGVMIAATAGLLVSAPAHADSTGLFNVSIGNCGYGYRQYCTGYGQGVPVGLSSLVVTIACSANSPFVVDRTGVGCFIRGLSDGRTYLNTGSFYTAGNSSETAKEGSVPFQGYQLCVGAGYSTSTGGGQAVQNYHCQ